MVIGLEVLREAFKGYEDCYTIIGGTACDILMSRQNLDFRATKDIDLDGAFGIIGERINPTGKKRLKQAILLIENRFEEFGTVLWKFIKAGQYKCGWKNSKNLQFYRFTEPQNSNYPIMIELFSKNPGYQLHDIEAVITPLHISDEISSLSAIMLNDDYYEFMLSGRKTVNGVGVLGAEHLIPFKMKAWLDLCRRKNEGEHVNSKDIKKHKNDVFRLMNIINPEERIDLPETVQDDVNKFVERMPEERINMKNIGLDMELYDALHILENMYLL